MPLKQRRDALPFVKQRTHHPGGKNQERLWDFLETEQCESRQGNGDRL